MGSEFTVQHVDDNLTTSHVSIGLSFLFRKLFILMFRHNNIFDRKQKFQAFLAVAAFATFGIGDGVTSALMIELCGIGAEANPFVRFVIETQDSIGLIIFKLWITMALLSIILIIQDLSKGSIYWATNGFLAAFGIGGILAMMSNLIRTFSVDIIGCDITPSPIFLIQVYFMLTIGIMAICCSANKKINCVSL